MTDTTNSVTDALQPVEWIRKNGIRFNAEAEPQDDSETALYSQTDIDTLRAQLAEAQRELIAKESERAGLELERNNAQRQHTTQCAINKADSQRILELTAQLAEAQRDAERLATYFSSWRFTPEAAEAATALLPLELRAFNDDHPTLDEWRAAIDAAKSYEERNKHEGHQ